MMAGTVADRMAQAFAGDGVRHVYGVPGGGSSLDLIRACADNGMDFVLARTEAAAVVMAAVSSELTGAVGVAVTTRGPGVACAANGVAYASLDRAPVIYVSDGWSDGSAVCDTHQVFDQPAMLAPVVKAHTRLEGDDPGREIADLIELARAPAPGPVDVVLTAENARREVAPQTPRPVEAAVDASPDTGDARAWLAAARRPVMIVGLEARPAAAAAAVRRFADALRCPVLTTYKAKGVVPHGCGHLAGVFTGGAVERSCVAGADLVVLVGLDPVELIGQPWPYTAPVVEITERRHPVHYVEPVARAEGPLAASLDALTGDLAASGWSRRDIARHRDAMMRDLAYVGSGRGLTPDEVVDAAAAAAHGLDARIAVDAGAHMFSAMARWPCSEPSGALISNGLSTMAFSLPAGIAASIADPERPVIAFTGDGGLMMCAGELSTAAQYAGRLCVVVFNDATLSLIGIKQQARQLPRAGVDWPSPDFASVAEGFGVRGFRAHTLAGYREALDDAMNQARPALIDVAIDPSGYPAQSRALRG